MTRMNERSSKKAGGAQSKFLKNRVTARKGKNVTEGRLTKGTGNKRDLA